MGTKKQHYVPQVYLKAWETEVETITEPEKTFCGVYIFSNGSVIGNGANRESILWKPHLYTIKFDMIFLINKKNCPEIFKYFSNEIYNLMTTNKKPFYAKLDYNIINKPKSINKHISDVDKWEFFYEDNNIARKKKILNCIHDLNCYILENSFDSNYEKYWEDVYNRFIGAVHDGTPIAIGKSERRINFNACVDMLRFFFMMLCRSPQFDGMGVYTSIKERILSNFFDVEASDELMKAIWYSELYMMFFKNASGFYHNMIYQTMTGCQMILFEAYDDSGSFLTSDNPAFQHISFVETMSLNGFVFPITSKYLLFIAKGDRNSIDIVDHRFANKSTIKHFNNIIKSHKINHIVSNQRTIK